MTRLFLLLGLFCAGSASVAGAKWHEATTRHFIITSDMKPADLRRYADRLERFDGAVRRLRQLGDPPLSPASKLKLYVLPSLSAVRRISGISHAAGFYIGRASGAVAFAHRQRSVGEYSLTPEHIFYHEYFHHMMLSDLRASLPAWMIEGYAEYFATAHVMDDGRVQVGKPPLVRAYGLLQRDGLTLTQLLNVERPRGSAERDSVYGLGWLLTHYLTFEPSRRGQIERYVGLMQQGVAPLAAAQQAFGDLGDLDRALQKYLMSKTLSVLEVQVPASGPIEVRALTAPQEAILDVQMRSARGVLERDARGVAAEARTIAARFPQDATVLGALAEAEIDARNHDAALAAADRALAVDARSTQALITKGRVLLEKAGTDPKADWAEVRRLFVRANRIDTEDAEPLLLYYRTFLASGERPPKPAVDGLIYALALAPQDRGLRFTVVRQMIADGRFADAGKVFTPLAYDPHLPAERRALLAKVMDLLRASDTQGAIGLLDADLNAAAAELGN